jgi:hypothetical protein
MGFWWSAGFWSNGTVQSAEVHGRRDPWAIRQVRTLSPRFRRGKRPGDFWGDGLVLWPPDTELESRLQAGLR